MKTKTEQPLTLDELGRMVRAGKISARSAHDFHAKGYTATDVANFRAAVNLEETRRKLIRETCERAGASEAFATELIDRDVTPNEAAMLVGEQATNQPETPEMEATYDNPVFRGEAAAEALACRIGSTAPSEAARPYMRYSIVDLARDCLGERAKDMSATRVVHNALHSTSDFPHVLENSLNKAMRTMYEAAPSGARVVSARTTSRDFRPLHRVQLGEAPSLQKVIEGAEYQQGTIGDAKETLQLETYGRILAISREAMINDDLDAFARVGQLFAQAAIDLEARTLADVITANPTMADGNALFSSQHGNLAGTGGGIEVSTVSSAREAMRKQKGLDGKTHINVSPRIILVPSALETQAEKIISEVQARQVSDVNVFAGQLLVAVEPRLDDHSETAWYLFSDPAALPALEHAYLRGEEGPQIISRPGFEVDGLETKCRHDFGAGATEWRAAFKNPGE